MGGGIYPPIFSPTRNYAAGVEVCINIKNWFYFIRAIDLYDCRMGKYNIAVTKQ